MTDQELHEYEQHVVRLKQWGRKGSEIAAAARAMVELIAEIQRLSAIVAAFTATAAQYEEKD